MEDKYLYEEEIELEEETGTEEEIKLEEESIVIYSGEGTSDYEELVNKPSINGVLLTGDKTLDELGIKNGVTSYNELTDKPTIPTKTSELENDNGFITNFIETDPTVPQHVKNITLEQIEKWDNGTGGTGGITEEQDPTVPQHVKNITEQDIEKWNSNTGGGTSESKNIIVLKKDEEIFSRVEGWKTYPVKFQKIDAQIGTDFTVNEDGQIVIGKGINHIKVTASVEAGLTHTSNAPYMQVYIRRKRGSNETVYAVNRIGELVSTKRKYAIINPVLIPVQEGDIIFINFLSSVNGDAVVTGGNYSYVTVENV